ncbi:hypothetical protein VTI74DRAFT_3644 [Chaetomium olivicolor]
MHSIAQLPKRFVVGCSLTDGFLAALVRIRRLAPLNTTTASARLKSSPLFANWLLTEDCQFFTWDNAFVHTARGYSRDPPFS